MKRARTIVLGIGATHFVVSRIVFGFVFARGMARFETGEPLSAAEAAMSRLNEVLQFPMSIAIDSEPGTWFPGLWGYIPLAANSVVWGVALYAVAKRIAKR